MEKKFVLIEVVERTITTPEFFDTYDEAYRNMEKRYIETASAGCDEGDEPDGELNEWDAWCESANHDNCDWAIFEI